MSSGGGGVGVAVGFGAGVGVSCAGGRFAAWGAAAGGDGCRSDTGAGPLSMPELGWKHSYLMFWVVVIAIAAGLLTYMKRKKWW